MGILTAQIYYLEKYRSELMGLAILGVLLFHADVSFAGSIYWLPLQLAKNASYVGVDVFFLISGFSLARSWLYQKTTILSFYKKRFIRIVPIYWASLFLGFFLNFVILHEFEPKGFIADLLGLGFLSNRNYNHWFIPSILICYLLAPPIFLLLSRRSSRHRALNPSSLKLFLLSILIAIALAYGFLLLGWSKLLIFIFRLPTFVLGLLIGFKHFTLRKSTLTGLEITTSKKANQLGILFLIGLTVALFILIIQIPNLHDINWQYGLWWFPLIILTLPLCLLSTRLIAWVDVPSSQSSAKQLCLQCLKYLGQASFEIYLAHAVLFKFGSYITILTETLPWATNLAHIDIIIYSFLVIASIGIGHLFKNTSYSKA